MENLSYKNIKRIKNISHGENKIPGNTAYLDVDSKEFVLHFPDSKKGNILKSNINDLIILYQTIEGERYYTHLVQPIDQEIFDEKAGSNFRFGRWVRIIAFTGKDNLIPLTKASEIDLINSFGNALEIEKRLPKDSVTNYQKKIWNLFKPFFNPGLIDNSKDSQIYLNDELNEDFASSEGKLLFRIHRARERDSSLTDKKKEIAFSENKLFCEVCRFSFAKIYGQNYIECHHIVPISRGERKTKLEDLSLVCSNCHRMLHRKINGNYLSISQLKQLLKSKVLN